MCLKADYYAGLGSNMHAAYNVGTLVIRGFVFAYHVSQDRADINCFVPPLEAFRRDFSAFPKRVCADAGYGSLTNYRYLDRNGIGNYVKSQSWEGNASGSYPDLYRIDETKEIIACLGGKEGHEVSLEQRHPKKAGAVFFRVDGCNGCPFMPFCKKYMKDQSEDFKIFEVVKEGQRYKQQAEENLLSPKGIEMRVNRSIQVEGTFGILKRDYGRPRLNRRGLERVSTEMMLNFLGMNIAKLFRFYETGKLCRFWVAPDDLPPQKFRKPSAKKLARRGRKVNRNMLDGAKRSQQA